MRTGHRSFRNWGRTAPSDEVEHLLTPPADDAAFHNVKAWYRQICKSTGAERMQQIVYLNTKDSTPLEFEQGASLRTCLHSLATELHKTEVDDQPDGVQMCVLAATDSSTFRSAFSFPYQIYLILRQRDDQAGNAIHAICALLLSRFWTADEQEQDIIKTLLLQPRLFCEPWRVALPSRKKQKTPNLHPYGDDWEKLFRLHWEWPSNLNIPNFSRYSKSTPRENAPTQLRVSEYAPGDMDIYVWQPYKTKPRFESLRLVVLPTDPHGHRKVVATTSSLSLLDCLNNRSVFEKALQADGHTAQLFRLFEGVYCTLRDDVEAYINQVYDSIEALSMRGRTNPSPLKIQMLLHLQECLNELATRCEGNLETLKLILPPNDTVFVQGRMTMSKDLGRLYEHKKDLEHLVVESRRIAVTIRARRALMKDLLDMKHLNRTTMMTILVTLFVPVSLACSIFGMNITGSMPPKFEANIVTYAESNSSTSDTATFPQELRFAQTSLAQTGNRTWSLSAFLITALALLFGTIVLPLVGGPIFRVLVQFVRKHKTWWRVIVACLLICSPVLVAAAQWSGIAALAAIGFFLGFVQIALLSGLCVWNISVSIGTRDRYMLASWLALFIFVILCWILHALDLDTMSIASKEVISVLGLILPWPAILLLWFKRPEDFFITPAEYRKRRRNIRGGT